MRRLRTFAVLVCCGLILTVMLHCHNRIVSAQEGAQQKPTEAKQDSAKQDSAKQDPTTTPPKKPRGRLPNHYGKIGLSTQQREKIYGIQEQYRVKLQSLEKQFQALRETQEQEIQAVLTDNQRSLLEKLLNEAQLRRSSRSRKSSDQTVTPGDANKPEAPPNDSKS